MNILLVYILSRKLVRSVLLYVCYIYIHTYTHVHIHAFYPTIYLRPENVPVNSPCRGTPVGHYRCILYSHTFIYMNVITRRVIDS